MSSSIFFLLPGPSLDARGSHGRLTPDDAGTNAPYTIIRGHIIVHWSGEQGCCGWTSCEGEGQARVEGGRGMCSPRCFKGASSSPRGDPTGSPNVPKTGDRRLDPRRPAS